MIKHIKTHNRRTKSGKLSVVKAHTATTKQIQSVLEEWGKRKDRKVNPSGSFDRAGRWYPDESEKVPGSFNVRSPSRAYPYSYMTHARTLPHVARLYKVPLSDIKKYMSSKTKDANKMKKQHIDFRNTVKNLNS